MITGKDSQADFGRALPPKSVGGTQKEENQVFVNVVLVTVLQHQPNVATADTRWLHN